MDNTTQAATHRTTILDLPNEALLQIFGYFCVTFPAHKPQQYYRAQWPTSGRLELYKNRLVCRAFDRLISPLLCPVVNISLCSESINRLEGLLSNPLIAQGVRGIAISLRFRPRGIATDFRRYHAHAVSIIDGGISECDWHTEFQSYEKDDISEDAVTNRQYHTAWEKLAQIRYAWQQLLERESSREETHAATDGLENAESIDAEGERVQDKEAQGVLKRCFNAYAAAQEDQDRIVADGSFVRRVTKAISYCKSPLFVWFNESQHPEDDRTVGAIRLAMREGALSHALVQPHNWLDIESGLFEDEDERGLFFPASIMTDLPIACHDTGVMLRGIQIDCFPLLKGYNCLIPANGSVTRDPWARFAAACHNLEIFNFGQRGMNCSPVRPERQSTSDSAIINGFIGAACSGPHLQRFHLSMTPFRVRTGRSHPRDEEHSYSASPILASLTSTQLRSIVINNVEVCGQDLLELMEKISVSHLTDLYFASVALSRGCYTAAMSVLHDVVVSRRQNNSSVPKIMFSTLQGAEFGAPSTFNDDGNSWMFGGKEESDAFWNRLEEHQHPALLKRVEGWIKDGNADEPSPLLSQNVTKD